MADASARAPDTQLTIGRLSVGSIDRRASGWWGMLTLILTEAFLFANLLFSYYYFAVQYGRPWLPAELPSFRLSGPNTVILILSSVAIWFGERGARRNLRWRLVLGLLVGFVLGGVFVWLQFLEWTDKPFSLSSDSYASIYFTVTGFHLAHLIVGLLIIGPLAIWSALGYFDSTRIAPVTVGALYWYFVNVVWLTVFFTIYITPYLS